MKNFLYLLYFALGLLLDLRGRGCKLWFLLHTDPSLFDWFSCCRWGDIGLLGGKNRTGLGGERPGLNS